MGLGADLGEIMGYRSAVKPCFRAGDTSLTPTVANTYRFTLFIVPPPYSDALPKKALIKFRWSG